MTMNPLVVKLPKETPATTPVSSMMVYNKLVMTWHVLIIKEYQPHFLTLLLTSSSSTTQTIKSIIVPSAAAAAIVSSFNTGLFPNSLASVVATYLHRPHPFSKASIQSWNHFQINKNRYLLIALQRAIVQWNQNRSFFLWNNVSAHCLG
jgi:hypothetical protein